MMRFSPFDFSGFYNSSGYPGYEYYGYQPTYARRYGVGQPLMEANPYLRHEYNMPVEIPIIHEGRGTSPASERKSSEAKKPKIPEDETVGPDMTVRKEIQPKKQPSPQPHQKKPSSRPYGTRQVPVNQMESSENVYDDELPFYPEALSEMYEDGYPFGNGFPFLTSPRRSPCTNMPENKATSQKAAAKSAPKIVNKPAEKSSPKKTPATSEPQTAAQRQPHAKVRQVPVVMETAEHACAQQQQPKLPAKKLLSAMEQLENIQKEMEVIEDRVENFSGEKKDKEYIILDEMMTSLLLKLDMIESNGVEEIRNKRRQLVKHTQECVQKLERKVGIVSPAEETNLDEAKMMEAGDADTESEEETDPEVTDEVMDSQGTPEERTRAQDLDAEKAPLTERPSRHGSDQSPRLEGKMQTQVDETASSLQAMVVDNTENRTLEQTMVAGDTITTTDSKDVETITDTKQVG